MALAAMPAVAAECAFPLDAFVASEQANGLTMFAVREAVDVAPDCATRTTEAHCGYDHELMMLDGARIVRWLVRDNCIISMPLSGGRLVPKVGA